MASEFMKKAKQRLAAERKAKQYDPVHVEAPAPKRASIEALRENFLNCPPRSPEFGRARTAYLRAKHHEQMTRERGSND